MASSNRISCKLNKYFRSLLAESNWNFKRANWDDVGFTVYSGNIEIDNYPETSMSCCGMDEINFTSILHYLRNEIVDKVPHWDELIAKWVKYSAYKNDHRVLIASCVIYPNNSNYNEIYKAIAKSLVKFGFKQLTKKPYVNSNTGHQILAFAGQL